MSLGVDAELAARLEWMSARELESFYEASRLLEAAPVSALLRVGGGVATYLAPGSPLNHAVGIGFGPPVTAEDVATLEEFFSSRGERATVALSPLADPSSVDAFAQRGWTLGGYENVLVRWIGQGARFGVAAAVEATLRIEGSDQVEGVAQRQTAAGIEVAEAFHEEDRDLWAHVAAIGFSAPLTPLPEQLWVAAVAARRPETRLFIGYVDGRAAGTGELSIHDGIAWLSADTTLPAFRRRGVQQALQQARLQAAAEAGCALAVSEALPGSGSQRNMERLGFRVAYTRVELVAPATVFVSGSDEG